MPRRLKGPQSQQALSSSPHMNGHVEGAGEACAQEIRRLSEAKSSRGRGCGPTGSNRLSPQREAPHCEARCAPKAPQKNSPSDSEDHSGRAATVNHPDGQRVGGTRSTYTKEMVEPRRFELLTSCLQSRRSAN
jgi:hypothetical protein